MVNSTLFVKKRCAEVTTPTNINDGLIMSNKSISGKVAEPSHLPNDDDKINIAISRRLLRSLTYIGTHIIVPVLVYSFSPYLPSAQTKPTTCSLPPSVQISPKPSR